MSAQPAGAPGPREASEPREARRARRRRIAEAKQSLRELRIELAILNHRVGSRSEVKDGDFDCLDVITRHGPISPTTLARRIGVHLATMTGILDRLERGGWIARARDERDRRAVVVRGVPGKQRGIIRLYDGMKELARRDPRELLRRPDRPHRRLPAAVHAGRAVGRGPACRGSGIVEGMLDLGFWHVDVFSPRALRGNGLVVVGEADGLSAAVMQEVTREVRQFETVFLPGLDLVGLCPAAGSSSRTRSWISPVIRCWAPRPCCTHSYLAPKPNRVGCFPWHAAGSRSGPAARPGGWTRPWIEGIPHLGPVVTDELAEAYRDALNLTRGQLHPALPMQVVSTGLPYLIVPVQGGLERARIGHPDFEGLLAASGAELVYVLDPARPEGRTWDNAGLGRRRSDRQRGWPGRWLPAAPRRAPARGARAGPPGPVHRPA